MSGELFFQTPLLILIFSDTTILILLLIALISSVKIIKKWDFKSTTKEQYDLEKKDYLTTLIIKVSLILSIVLLPYFVYTIDLLHNIIPGAMCGAGVIGANEYGNPLLIGKIATIFLSGFWLILDRIDLETKEFLYIKKRYYLFISIFVITLICYILEIKYFTNISLERVVSCCSVIFGASGDNALPFNLDTTSLLVIFYLLAILNIYNIWQKNSIFLALSSLLFIPIAYYAITYFFGTYIYELPTHICPFCMLQSEYHYVGYLIWGLLFVGTFYGVANGFLKILTKREDMKYFKYSLYSLLMLLGITLSFVISYRLRTGTFLS